MASCAQAVVTIQKVKVTKSESYGDFIGFTGEPGSSAEWDLQFTVAGQTERIRFDNVRDGSELVVNRSFLVDLGPLESLDIGVSGVEVDDSSANDTMPRAEYKITPASNWSEGQSFERSAASHPDFGYSVVFDIRCAYGKIISPLTQADSGTDRYLGTWEKTSSSAWVARHGLDSAQYQAVFNDLVSQGFQPTILNGYSINGQDRYICVFEQTPSVPWVARHGLTGAQYQAVFDDLVPKGYRPTILSAYNVGGEDRYLGVWKQIGGGAWVARHGLNGAQYQAVFDDLVPKGYRPTILSGYNIGGEDRYVCAFEQKGGGAWVARHGLNGAQYQAVFDDLVPKGYRPTILSGYNVGGQDRYICMFEQKGSGDYVARHYLTGA